MLEFSTDLDRGWYIIKETSHGFTKDFVKYVRYTFDLKRKQVNDEPWYDTSKCDIMWFDRHYRNKF